MLILRGFVVDVIDKQGATSGKSYAIVGIQSESTDGDGFVSTSMTKLMVFGRDFQNGLHNAYRAQKGAEVFAPVRVDTDDRGDGLRYFLAGTPLRLADKPAQTGPAPAPVPKTA